MLIKRVTAYLLVMLLAYFVGYTVGYHKGFSHGYNTYRSTVCLGITKMLLTDLNTLRGKKQHECR